MQLVVDQCPLLHRQNLAEPMNLRSSAGAGSLDFFNLSIFFVARPENEDRTHNRLHKHGVGLDVPVSYFQVPMVVDLDSEEVQMENWPFLMPSDFVLASFEFEHFFCQLLVLDFVCLGHYIGHLWLSRCFRNTSFRILESCAFSSAFGSWCSSVLFVWG